MKYLISIGFILCLLIVSAEGQGSEPKTSVSVTIPDYQVSTDEGMSAVTIPGGSVLEAEEGRPVVPYYREKIAYPRSHRVSQVTMKERAGKRDAPGLKLALVNLDTVPLPSGMIKRGVYPLRDFSWRMKESDEGSDTLVLEIFPFFYDPATSQGTFYNRYEFNIAYVRSTVQIGSVVTDKIEYDPGDVVKVTAELSNTGTPVDVGCKGTVYRALTKDQKAQIPGTKPERLEKSKTITLDWPTANVPTGTYTIEVAASDPAGNLLATNQVTVMIGRPALEITGFDVTPKQFKLGDKVQFTLNTKNSGTTELVGAGVFQVLRDDELIEELTQPFPKTRPGASATVSTSWNTSKAVKGALYRVIAFVRFDGWTSEAREGVFSTNQMPVASFTFAPAEPKAGQDVKFDASESSDADGSIAKYEWEFDDGTTATGPVATHRHPDPGDHLVRLTVTDNEGGYATSAQTIKVK